MDGYTVVELVNHIMLFVNQSTYLGIYVNYNILVKSSLPKPSQQHQ